MIGQKVSSLFYYAMLLFALVGVVPLMWDYESPRERGNFFVDIQVLAPFTIS